MRKKLILLIVLLPALLLAQTEKKPQVIPPEAPKVTALSFAGILHNFWHSLDE